MAAVAPPEWLEPIQSGRDKLYATTIYGHTIRWRYTNGTLAELVVTRGGKPVNWRVREAVLRRLSETACLHAKPALT